VAVPSNPVRVTASAALPVAWKIAPIIGAPPPTNIVAVTANPVREKSIVVSDATGTLLEWICGRPES
jgi:hypothetical protein